MHLTCPHCLHAVEYSTDRPRFCSFCGQALAAEVDDVPTLAAPPPSDGLTGDFHPSDTSSFAPAAGARAEVPDQLGGYRLVRRLGGGGMGSVYQAEHIATGQKVALKLIKPDFARSPQAVERFRQEGRLASAVIHPRCVFVLAADEEAGQPYIVMELMPGTTLADYVDAHGPLPHPEAVKKILDVIDGLQEAHRLDVIHRDVKPSNCFLEAGGRVKVGDFGLAKSVSDDTQLTRTGSFLGTPLFSSPEQIKRQPVTAQTDVYSVSATLYFLLTGQAPFAAGGDAIAAVARIVSEDAPPLRPLAPSTPKSLERIILRGLERDTARRWPDLESMRRALVPYLPGQLSFGGLGVRLVAYVVDSAIVGFLAFTLMFGLRSSMIAPTNPTDLFAGFSTEAFEDLLVGAVFHLLYFGLLEGLLGWTVGKRLARLRVCTTRGVDPPGLWRGALRAMVQHEILNAWAWLFILILVVARPHGNFADGVSTRQAVTLTLLGLLPPVGYFVGIALILFTMRKRNGYRGLHEFGSGTRVVQLPAPQRRRSYACPGYRLETTRPPGMPGRVGAFVIREAVQWTDAEKTLVAEDELLHRAVWVWLRPWTEPAVDPRRRDLNRASRLRWVTGGTDTDWRWDAYLAPHGVPLPALVAARGRFAWADTLPILVQLSDELATASRERTTPKVLNVQQVLVDPAGRVQLLGTKLEELESEDGPVPAAAGRSDAERSLSLLAQTAALMLEGKPRMGDGLDRPLRAPLPAFLAEPLNRLFNKRDPHSGPAAFRTALAALREQPAEVPRAPRFLHSAAIGLFAFFGVLAALVAPVFGPVVVLSQRAIMADLVAADMEREAARDLALDLLRPDPVPFGRAVAVARYLPDAQTVAQLRQRRDRDFKTLAEREKWSVGWMKSFRELQEEEHRDVWATSLRGPNVREWGPTLVNDMAPEIVSPTFGFVALAVVALAWMLWSAVARGGFVLRTLGLTLVRTDGRKASRLRCAWRALLFWLPVVALFGTSVWLDATYWSHWADPSRRAAGRWMLWWSWLLWWAGLLLMPIYLGAALWKPERAPHDRLAGTWLVPR